MNSKPKIVILGGARDYHAMDWYRSVREAAPERDVVFLTDMIGGEGFQIILKPDDNVSRLFIIDWLLCRRPSKIGNLWRNVLKLLVLPVQILALRRFAANNRNCIYHAHPMYYMLLAWLSGIDYIGTPQGSEILVRPNRSMLYRFFAIKLLRMASHITVDSSQMASKIYDMAGINALIVQYGINLNSIFQCNLPHLRNIRVASIRGMTDLYRIREILDARDASVVKPPISFIYPFHDEGYLKSIRQRLAKQDTILGRLNKEDMYRFLTSVELVLSIPKSDSSPRSVYEAIFLGCCVASPYNPWMDALPLCVAERIIVVDLDDAAWLEKALVKSAELSRHKFVPSEEAVNLYDQTRSMARLINQIYV